MTAATFLLASSSPYRAALMQRLRLPFIQASPDIDESPADGETPEQYVERLAIEKTKALASQYPQHWIIGSDQTCVIDGRICGKPHSEEKALIQLQAAQGKRITFLTGLCLFHPASGSKHSLVEPFYVNFRELSDEELKHYIALEQPLDCAGSFKMEGLGINLFSSFEGRDSNSLMGLPLMGLCDLLREARLNPLLLATQNNT